MSLGLVVVVSVTACGGGGSTTQSSGPTAQPSLGAVPTIKTEQQVTRPIDTYLPDASQVLQAVTAETRRINSCLVKKGHTGTYAPPSKMAAFVAGGIADNVVRNDLWGFFETDMTQVATYGYGRPPAQPSSLTFSVPDNDGTAWQECMQEADKELPGQGGPASLIDVHSLPQRGPQVPLNDTRWIAAEEKWAQCMAAAGFSQYKTPLAAVGDTAWASQGSPGKPSSQEIATATADVNCKIKTNLVGVGLAIQDAYDQEYIQANENALNAYRNQIAAYLAN